jgi:hypothetical protein
MSKYTSIHCEIHGVTYFDDYSENYKVKIPGNLGLLSDEQEEQLAHPVSMCGDCKRALERYTPVEIVKSTYKVVEATKEEKAHPFSKALVDLKNKFQEIEAVYVYETLNPEYPHYVVEFKFMPINGMNVWTMNKKHPLSFAWNDTKERGTVLDVKKLRLLLTLAHLEQSTNFNVALLVNGRFFPIRNLTAIPVSFKQVSPVSIGKL